MKSKLLLIAIIILGVFFRFYDINWDQNQHLHPDERFLTMVGTAMTPPPTFVDYLNTQKSTFNPANINYPFYVYGTFPIVVNKLLALKTGADNYTNFVIQGRMLSAFLDALIILLVFKTLELFEKRHKLNPHIKYWGALFYAIAVLPIQLSHFFAVDTFLNFFLFASFYFAVRFNYTKNFIWLIVSAAMFGLAIGSKISAIYIFPLIGYFLLTGLLPKHPFHVKEIKYLKVLGSLALYAFVIYLVGRIADPYLFENGRDFFDPHISKLFLENIKSLQGWSTPEAWFPPAVQWVHKIPIIFPLSNLVLFGIGIGYTVFVVIGGYIIIGKYKKVDLIAMIVLVVLFFIYQGMQFSSTMRYFLPIYPFLAMFAAMGFYELTRGISKYLTVYILLLIFIWPLLFFSIYTKDHSRNLASVWMYDNIPNGSVLITEHWDDALPLSTNPPSTKQYVQEQLPVFDADNPEKWERMKVLLNKSDFYILTSNRGWGSIPTVPERYPQMTKFYSDLFAGKTVFKKVAEFTSYPSLQYLGIPVTISDDISEEAFTVYDHPKVIIFRRVGTYE